VGKHRSKANPGVTIMSVNAETVRDLIGKLDLFAGPSRLIADVPLVEQGLDSLDFVNLMFGLEEVYGINLPDSDLEGIATIDDIVSFVNRKLAAQP